MKGSWKIKWNLKLMGFSSDCNVGACLPKTRSGVYDTMLVSTLNPKPGVRVVE